MLEKILIVKPCSNVQLYDEDILEMDSDRMTGIIDSSDLIIEATDSVKSKLFVNGMAIW